MFDFLRDLKLTPHRLINRSNKNVISCCVYKMENSYRPFDVYLKLLISTYQIISGNPKWIFRIYFDENCKKEILENIHNENIELIEYSCDKVKTKSKDFHIGNFGMLVRFLPLFDSEINYTFITDIDINEPNANFFNKHLENIIGNNIPVCYLYLVGYGYRYPRIFLNKIINNVILAQICSSRKYNINILNNFVNDLLNDKYKDICELIYTKKTQAKPNHYPFLYGIDEFFLNKFILPIDIEYDSTHFIMLRDFDLKYCISKTIETFNNKKFPEDIEKIMVKFKRANSDIEFYSNSEYYDIIRKYIIKNYKGNTKDICYINILIQEKYFNSLNDNVNYNIIPLDYMNIQKIKKYFK
jgi:hypothetical protein